MMDKGFIDFVLKYRECIQIAINNTRADMDTRKVGGNGNGHCRISDPTAETAIRHIDPIGTVEVYYGPVINGIRASRNVPDSERWLRISNETWKFFRHSRHYKLMQLMYIEDLRGKELEIAARKALHIGRRRCYYMQLDIRKHAYRLGKSLKLHGCDVGGVKSYPRTTDILKKLREKKNDQV